MIRRSSLALIAFAAVAALSGRAHASGIANFQIVNHNPAGTAPLTDVLAEIQPPGAVDAPTGSKTSPMTVLAGSSGFDAKDLTFNLGNNQAGQNVALDIIFSKTSTDPGPGFAPGGVLNFSLNTVGSTAPTLTLVNPTTDLPPVGLTLSSFTPPTTGTGTGTTGTTTSGNGSTAPSNNVPEPISLAVWSVAAGLGLLRARAFRRARQIAS